VRRFCSRLSKEFGVRRFPAAFVLKDLLAAVNRAKSKKKKSGVKKRRTPNHPSASESQARA
jgi:hypothetical protein